MPQTEYAIQLEHVTKTFGPVIAKIGRAHV